MNGLDKFGRMIALLEESLLALLLGAMAILITSQFYMHHDWHGGINWHDPALRILILWLGLLGAMAAARSSDEPRTGLISGRLPTRMAPYLTPTIHLAGAVICAMVCYQSGHFVLLEYKGGGSTFAAVPGWCYEAIIPAGFGLMALRFLATGIGALLKVRQQPSNDMFSKTGEIGNHPPSP